MEILETSIRKRSLKMARITADDLDRIKEKRKRHSALGKDGYTVQITVHLGTCGIAAGGDEVYKALQEEIAASGRKDINVVISGCAGMCSSEPNVTVGRMGEDAVIYRDLDAKKMHKIFQGHVLEGEIQAKYALARIRQAG
jgi:NADP-reducing hydrogenase subunit HndB